VIRKFKLWEGCLNSSGTCLFEAIHRSLFAKSLAF
jgi:hypothetical protein